MRSLFLNFLIFVYGHFFLVAANEISQDCLECICQASTGCNLSAKCHNGGPNAYWCGPYQISWAYWADGGKPGTTGHPTDFEDCLNNKHCAEIAIRGYMTKWAKDCNNDGIIDCLDFAAIHKAGANQCNSQWLYNSDYWNRFRQCHIQGSSNLQPRPQNNVLPHRPSHSSNPINHPNTNVAVIPGRAPANPISWSTIRPSHHNNPGRPRPEDSFGSGEFGQPFIPSQPAVHNDQHFHVQPNEQPINTRPHEQPAHVRPVITPDRGSEDTLIETGIIRPVNSVSASDSSSTGLVGVNCLECLCQASSDCNVNKQCSGEFCGPYLISWAYWADGGKPGADYVTCANNKICAEHAIQGYMNKWKRDCNGDGIIDCNDYAAIHKLGPHSCNSQALFQSDYWVSYESCISPAIDARRGNQPALSIHSPSPRVINSVASIPVTHNESPSVLQAGPNPSSDVAVISAPSIRHVSNQSPNHHIPSNNIPSTRNEQPAIINTPTESPNTHSFNSNPSIIQNQPGSERVSRVLVNPPQPQPQLQPQPQPRPQPVATRPQPSNRINLARDCMECICQASSKCDFSTSCQIDSAGQYICGPYKISWDYWKEAGQPGNTFGDFQQCLSQKECAEATLHGYMDKWANDCNGDGVIDCNDFAAIHKLKSSRAYGGHDRCDAQWFYESQYWSDFRECFDFRRK